MVLRLKIRLAIRHTYNEPAGQRDEVSRCQAEDGVWRPGGGPDVIEAQQALIDASSAAVCERLLIGPPRVGGQAAACAASAAATARLAITTIRWARNADSA